MLWQREVEFLAMVSFHATVLAIGGVFLMGALGYFAFRRRIITDRGLTEISRVLIDICLPAALLHSMFIQYDPTKKAILLYVGVAQILFLASGMLAMLAVAKLWELRQPLGTLCGLASLQNNVYLPLPIALALLGAHRALEIQFVIGCFVLFFTPILWSVGVILVTGHHHTADHWSTTLRRGLNAPFFAAFLGLLAKLMWLRTGWHSPTLLLNVLKTLGDATVPLAMLVLGGMLAETHLSRALDLQASLAVALVKLIIVPVAGILFLKWAAIENPVLRFIILLESSMPPATNISIIVRRYGGAIEFVTTTTFLTYLACVVTVPLWLLFNP